ncbi:hypothetical protein PF914_000991 [Salmonella enterica]|nr:hypothetical protein [Salmonella enterica]
MAKYFIRVELQNVNESTDYDKLHEYMRNEGYKREYKKDTSLGLASTLYPSEPSLTYRLPTAVYITETFATVGEVLKHVEIIASRVKPDPMVVVVEYTSIAFCNLTVI